MTPEQLIKLKALRRKLFDAMLFDTDPEHWVGYGKSIEQLTKQEKEEASWCRRQASSSILLWEKIDKLVKQANEPQQKTLAFADVNLNIDAFEQEANELLAQLKAKELDEK